MDSMPIDLELQGADRMDKQCFHAIWMDTLGQEVMITKEGWQPKRQIITSMIFIFKILSLPKLFIS